MVSLDDLIESRGLHKLASVGRALPATSFDNPLRNQQPVAECGQTPLWVGLERARTLIEQEQQRSRDLVCMAIVVSDGRANVGQGALGPGEAVGAAADALREVVRSALVVDTESGFVRLELARRLAEQLGADYIPLDKHDSSALANAVRMRRPDERRDAAMQPGRAILGALRTAER